MPSSWWARVTSSTASSAPVSGAGIRQERPPSARLRSSSSRRRWYGRARTARPSKCSTSKTMRVAGHCPAMLSAHRMPRAGAGDGGSRDVRRRRGRPARRRAAPHARRGQWRPLRARGTGHCIAAGARTGAPAAVARDAELGAHPVPLELKRPLISRAGSRGSPWASGPCPPRRQWVRQADGRVEHRSAGDPPVDRAD